jgi:hypothetical protein
MHLVRVGYWRSDVSGDLPDPARLVDEQWDRDDREVIASYLDRGFVVRAYLGRATCRLCGSTLGSLDVSDGTYCWPDGLGHYVLEHAVRLPESFLEHVRERVLELEEADLDHEWWRTASEGL